MNFILHIGDGKSGSAAIQYALSQKTEELRKNGIVCDNAVGGHGALPALVGKASRDDNSKVIKKANRAVDNLRSASEKNPQSSIVISAESFMRLSVDDVISLLHRIAPKISDVKIIAYVRNPADRYLSFIQQEIKGSAQFKKPNQYVHRIDQELEKWLSTEFCSDVIVRPFDKDRLKDNSVVSDFRNVLENLTTGTIELDDYSTNTTLSAEQMITLQYFRSYCGFTNGKLHLISDALISLFQRLNNNAFMGNKPQLDSQARRSVEQKNKPIFDRLNTLFPTLRLYPDYVDQNSDDCSLSWTNSVRSVLKEYDSDGVEMLAGLIPFSDKSIQSDMIPPETDALHELAERYNANKERVVEDYSIFLKDLTHQVRG